MRKHLYQSLAVLLALVGAVSCTEKLGTEPGNDPEPVITIFQYAATSPYNSDNDVFLRFVANDKTESGYYFLEPTEDMEAHIASLGEDGYADYVVSNGTALSFDPETSSADAIVTDLFGEYTITGVAIGSGIKNLCKTTFLGLDWDTETEIPGTYYFSIPPYYGMSEDWDAETVLQVCTTDETLYRFKDVFGEGYSLKINLIDQTDEDSDGEYQFFRIPTQDTPYTYGSYGSVYVRDVGYWQGDDAYVTDYGYESGMYEDGTCFLMISYYYSGGTISYDYEYFIPD